MELPCSVQVGFSGHCDVGQVLLDGKDVATPAATFTGQCHFGAHSEDTVVIKLERVTTWQYPEVAPSNGMH